jgi:hypothetical protein
MIDKTVINLIEDCSKNKASYLKYIDNIDSIYDIDFIQTLYTIMKVQKESLDIMIKLLFDRNVYLKTITYSTVIIIEICKGDKSTQYYVFPRITPNIPDRNKVTFDKNGMWFENDEKSAISFAESLQKIYNGNIQKIFV